MDQMRLWQDENWICIDEILTQNFLSISFLLIIQQNIAFWKQRPFCSGECCDANRSLDLKSNILWTVTHQWIWNYVHYLIDWLKAVYQYGLYLSLSFAFYLPPKTLYIVTGFNTISFNFTNVVVFMVLCHKLIKII